MRKSTNGFTIVELLIVIVIIAILAAISIVAYNGIRGRAQASTATQDIASAIKMAGLSKANDGTSVVTTDLLSGDYAIKVSPGLYKAFAVCSSTNGEFAAGAELQSGDVYVSKNNGTITQSTTVTPFNLCSALGISAASTIFAGLPSSSCANENGTCTFSGTQTIAYGSAAQGRLVAKKDQTSPVACTNANFTDPASGFAKSCYVLQY